MRVGQEISLGPYEYIFCFFIYVSFNDPISLYGYSTAVASNPRQNRDTYPVMEQAFYSEALTWLAVWRIRSII
jgi:hypothetical protein